MPGPVSVTRISTMLSSPSAGAAVTVMTPAGGVWARALAEEVAQDLGEPVGVGDDAERRAGCPRRSMLPWTRLPSGRTTRSTTSSSVELAGLQAELAGLGEGELLEVVHEVLQRQRLLVDRVDDRRGRREQAVLQRLEVAADVGERRAQLVGHVVDHPPAQLLDALEAVGHGVEGAPELADLVARRDAGAAAEVPARHLPRDAGELLDRPQHPAGEQGGRGEGQDTGEEDGGQGAALDGAEELAALLGDGGGLAGEGEEGADRRAVGAGQDLLPGAGPRLGRPG